MNLGFVFKVSIYGLTALVGAILGAAEGEGHTLSPGQVPLPFVSLPLVICGYLVTERTRRNGSVGLSPIWANILGIVALTATAREFSESGAEAKLLAGTHLLLYATWIVLFQQKTIRLYWFIMALGILQLAVASVLTSKGWFGFCALIYTFGAVWTLSIFSLWRAEQHFQEQEDRRLNDGPTLADGPGDWPTFSAALSSEVRSAVQHEGGAQWLTGRFVTGVLLTTCSALMVSAGFFAFIPRVWGGHMGLTGDDNTPVPALNRPTSMGTLVRLGDLGQILESTEPVFEIKLTDQNSKKAISAQEYAEQLGLAEPLFRSGVLISYNRGQWESEFLSAGTRTRSVNVQFKHYRVMQTVRLEPNAPNILFCLGKPLHVTFSNQQPMGEFDESTGVAHLNDRKPRDELLEFKVYSELMHVQPLYHKLEISDAVNKLYNDRHYLRNMQQFPPNVLKLRELAAKIVRNEKERLQKFRGQNPEITKLEKATAIYDYLVDPKNYSYTLEQAVIDPNIDPIEDFLFNRKKGHCEYFATAMTLMLRSEQIPARLVTGFKGGESKKDWLEVQQRYAHVWVDAWLGDSGWTTFDPTPVDARSQSIASLGTKKVSLWSDVQSTLSGLWSDSILKMSLDRQEESIYKPIRDLATSTLVFFKRLFTSPRDAVRAFIDLFGDHQNWFSLGGFLFAVISLLCLAAIVFGIYKLSSQIRHWFIELRATHQLDSRIRIVEFYERFTEIMRSHGLIRSATQTQQEFALSVSSAFSPELVAAGGIDIPRMISQFFYDVRFGDRELSADEMTRIEDLLSKLTQALPNLGQQQDSSDPSRQT